MMMAGVRGSLREYLLTACGENRPWDRIFREVMAADESDAEQEGVERVPQGPRPRTLDRLTNDVSTVFFGVNVELRQVPRPPAGQGLEAGPLFTA